MSYRKEPKPGEVLLVDLTEGTWAYLLVRGFYTGWIYGFHTSTPTQHAPFQDRSQWKLPVNLGGRFTTDYRTVTKIEITKLEELGPPTVCTLDPNDPRHVYELSRAPTPYKLIYWKERGYVTAEKAATMYKSIRLDLENGELQHFIRNLLPEMQRIEVAPEGLWTPPEIKSSDLEPSNDPVLVEVHFQCNTEAMGMPADLIAEHLGDDLEVNDLGLLMTMDSGGVESEFEVILEVGRRRIKSAISQIRKTLRRLKAPADTRIIEVADTGPIEHPLVAPPKGK